MITSRNIEYIGAKLSEGLLVVEGANGSIGLSVLRFLQETGIKPKKMLLTTFNSKLDEGWTSFHSACTHLKASDPAFQEQRSLIINNSNNVTVLFGSGYGRPNKFSKEPISVINANIESLLGYANLDIEHFAFMSTSEVYTGNEDRVSEGAPLLSKPDHPRSVYIESKRLAEAVVHNILGPKFARVAVYRVALAFPPRLLADDHRVLADLVRGGLETGVVTLNGGAGLVRQYQAGVNAVYKMMGSLFCGTSTVYNNSGAHVITLGELASAVSSILGAELRVKADLMDETAPKVVLIDNQRINSESGYDSSQEKSMYEYLQEMIYG